MNQPPCPPDHLRAKTDDALWASFLPGVDRTVEVDDGVYERHVSRHCASCGATVLRCTEVRS